MATSTCRSVFPSVRSENLQVGLTSRVLKPAFNCTGRSFSKSRQAETGVRRSKVWVEAKVTKKGGTSSEKSSNAKDPKAAALSSVLDSIDKQFGKGTIMKLGEANQMQVETFPSGSMTLDLALGGGYPRGRIIEIYGPESSGKTTLALHAMAEVQKSGGTVALIDAEHAFDPEFASNLGLNVDGLCLCQPESGEDALEIVDQLVRSSAVDLIAVDSVSALVPRAEIEGEIGLMQVGSQARLMSHALKKLTQHASRCRCSIIFINQIRYKIGVMYGSPETTSGGNALKYYSSVRLDIRRTGVVKNSDGEEVGIHVRTRVRKNKVARPGREAEMDIMFSGGISAQGCLLDCALETNVVSRKGAWYSFGNLQLGQGREKSISVLEANPELFSEIKSAVRDAMSSVDNTELEEELLGLDAVDEVDLSDIEFVNKWGDNDSEHTRSSTEEPIAPTGKIPMRRS